MKTLILYSTKYGTAEKVAKLIASSLRGEVCLVNLKKEKPPLLHSFDAV